MIHFSKLKSQVLFKKLNIYFIYILLISISGFSILFSPQPDPNILYKQEYVRINKYMGFQINIDANDFVSSAADLQLIFAENQARQNRPLYILMGSILYYPFNTLLNLINYNEITFDSTVGKKSIIDKKIKNKKKVPIYMGYVFLNGVFMFISLLLFDKILKNAGVSQKVIFIGSLILLFNFIMKVYFWTAHTQQFIILSPLLSIYLLMKFSNSNYLIKKFNIILISVLCGILLLFYGLFILLIPILVLGIIFNNIYFNNKVSLVNISLVPIFFLSPILIWIIILNQTTFGYQNQEISVDRYFLWAFDYLNQGLLIFINQLLKNIFLFFKTLGVPFTLLLTALILGFHKNIKFSNNQLFLTNASIYIFAIYFLFFLCMGLYKVNYSFSLVPPILTILCLRIDQLINNKIYFYIFVISVLIWVIYNIFRYGPYY